MRYSSFQKAVYLIAKKLQKHCRLVAVLTVIFLCLSAVSFSHLKLDNSFTAFLPASSAELAESIKLLDAIPANKVLLIELRSPNQANVPQLLDAAKKIKSSLQPYLMPASPINTLEPEDLLRLLPALASQELTKELTAKSRSAGESIKSLRQRLAGNYGFFPKQFVQADPLGFLSLLLQYAGGFEQMSPIGGQEFPVLHDADGGGRVLLMLRPQASMQDAMASRALIEAVNKNIKANISEGVSFEMFGAYCYTAANTDAIERDLKLTMGFALAAIALIYAFTVRSWAALWLLLTPVATVLLVGTFMSWLWPAISGLALGFGSAVLGLAEDYVVLVYFGLRPRRTSSPHFAARTVATLARPMLFSAILCMTSFCILMFSAIPALQQLGFFAAASLFCGFLIAVFILPCFPGIVPKSCTAGDDSNEPEPQKEDNSNWQKKFSALTPRYLLVWLCVTILLGFCLWANSYLHFSPTVQAMGVNTAQMQDTGKKMLQRWGMEAQPQMLASSGENFNSALQAAYDANKALRLAYPSLKFASLADFMPPAEVQEENMRNWRAFQTNEAPALFAALNEQSGVFGFKPEAFTPFTNWLMEPAQSNTSASLKKAGLAQLLWASHIEKDGRHYIVTILPPMSDAAYTELPLKAFWQAEAATLHGNSFMLSTEGLTIELEQAFGQERHLFLWACLACFLVLLFCFRRPVLLAIACLPPLFGLSAVFLWMLLSGQSLSLAGLAAVVLLVGLGADYGIVMLHELAHSTGLGAYRSILVSSLTTLAGIGMLILAQHPVLHELGMVIFWGLSTEMFAVLLFMPYLLKFEKQIAITDPVCDNV